MRINSKILIIYIIMKQNSNKKIICIIHKPFRHLYMFPYYFNVLFRYFGFVPVFRFRFGKSRHPFAGMTLDKCIVLQIRTLTGCPLCRESHPLCRLKNPTVISIWVLVGFHPATRSLQTTPADNTRKRVWQYIEKERKSC